ncbi:toll-like receptor Tollo [Oppia nitens]|uniref:toll-like receptor Tollo n=1 Tax=Oppia nitens TaxID=1686743 RepID=UPI0023D99B7C|nr:toll-like receptor Tollo [Oppia nitens]
MTSIKTIMIWLLLSTVFMIVSVTNGAQYVAPGDCTWNHIPQSSFDVLLKCQLRTINPSGLNFSLIQTEHTISLTVVCDESLFESRLENGSLSHLRFLKSLDIENCKLKQLSGGALTGLQQLRNLTVRTHNNNLGSQSLALTHESLSSLKHLEKLDLGFNYIGQLPQDLFCPLASLKTLNLTQNRLSGFGSFGLIDPATGQLCLQELQRLDLSHNHISFLSETGVASLRNLQALYLQNNRIAELAELSFSALKKLHIIDLSNNLLQTIPSRSFRESEELKELHLQNNSLTVLPAGIFSGLSKLLILDLSHNLIGSEWIFPETFADLIRVVVLNLGFNRLKSINASTFQNQYSLQILYLNNNEIEQIGDNSFASLYNLHTLILKGNRLKNVYSFTFNGLYVLSQLSLAENEISRVDDNAFRNSSNLQSLHLNGNLLSEVPIAVSALRSLKSLYLSDNDIKVIKNSSFVGLNNLSELKLSGNELANLTRGTLKELQSLYELDLSWNRINGLDHGVFDDAPTLKTIQLDNNFLSDINGLFMNLNNLHYLNVSNNKITWFDYALIPRSLNKLDIHHNEIETLGNYFELESALQLEDFDVSHNLIKEISGSAIPNRIERINLSDNKIRVVHQFTFMAKHNITFVDLRNNTLQTLDINAFRLKALTANRQSPEFYVSSNPYYCDCTMEWLQRINSLDTSTRQYPRIVDLEQVMCQLPFVRHNQLVPLTKANSSNFLCKYKSHCFALCHCCDFDACDCEMMCPENCTCYYDQTWNTNVVDCSTKSYNAIPSRIPMDVTALYLDGNDIFTLTSHTFIGRKNMKQLYLNNSNIHNISNRTFNGLVYLEVLHLEYNQLTILHGYEFDSLHYLKELYLHHNRLHTINNNTFIHLKSLQVLHLEYNSIVEFQVFTLSAYNTRLSALYLSNNLWSCKCAFMDDFVEWARVSAPHLPDAHQIRCYYNSTHVGPYISQFNSTTCANNALGAIGIGMIGGTDDTKVNQQSNNNLVSLLPPNQFIRDNIIYIAIVFCLLILVCLMIVLLCVYRKELKVWMYSKYGVRLFQRSRYTPETEKLFDSFVSYCKKDEAFIAQILAPELECGHPPYRLCLRYRDLPMSGYVAEAITEAIECSHRTIILLSEHFLKSEWCRFELKAAHQETQCNKNHKLVVVLLDKNNLSELDADTRMCLRSVPVIHWGDRRFWEKLRYAMPPARGQLNKPMNCPDVRASLEFKRAVNNMGKAV